jgi:hypothetical protein
MALLASDKKVMALLASDKKTMVKPYLLMGLSWTIASVHSLVG